MICRKTNPARYEYPKKMAVGENRHIACNRPKRGHNVIGPLRYPVDRFSVRTRVCPDAPIGYPFSNLLCGQPFVIAVVPFLQFFIRFHPLGKPGELCCFQRALERTAKDTCKFYLIENWQKESS